MRKIVIKLLCPVCQSETEYDYYFAEIRCYHCEETFNITYNWQGYNNVNTVSGLKIEGEK